MRSIRSVLVVSAIALATASAFHAGEAPTTPDAVRPLLVGAKVPAVELKRSDGSKVDLAQIVSEQPSILVFYRGGW